MTLHTVRDSAMARAPAAFGLCALAFLLLASVAAFAADQAPPAAKYTSVFKARLSPLGVTNATVNTTTGVGAVTATLVGRRLTIAATFEGLTGAATAANIRRGAKGIPGPVIFDLPVSKTTSGTITATVDLNAEQVVDLHAGRWYLQIHSERAPDGSIRGWLLK